VYNYYIHAVFLDIPNVKCFDLLKACPTTKLFHNFGVNISHNCHHQQQCKVTMQGDNATLV